MYIKSLLLLTIVYLSDLSQCLEPKASPPCSIRKRRALFNTQYVQDGDVIIGGIFTLSNTVRLMDSALGHHVFFCDMPLPRFYRYVLSFIFAIDDINKNPDILPNVTVGYHAYDSCNHVNKAIDSVLHILSGPGDTVPNYCLEDFGYLVGVIGDQNPDLSSHIAQILSIYGYAQISYGTANPLITSSRLHPPFFQALPNYQTQYLAIVQLLRNFNWTWIGVITSDDDVGEKQSQELKAMAAKYDICVEYIIYIGEVKEEYKIKRMTINNSTSQVIVICGKVSLSIMYILSTLSDDIYEKTLILPAGWIAQLSSSITKSPLPGSLLFSPPTKLFPELKKYIQYMILSHPVDCFMEYMMAYYLHCLTSYRYLNKILQHQLRFQLWECNRTLLLSEKISPLYQSEDFRVAYLVYKSVYAMAHSLHDVQQMIKNTNKSYREHHTFVKHVRCLVLRITRVHTQMISTYGFQILMEPIQHNMMFR